jgi:cob(I)alamin adenosyltransferase
MKIYTKTGDTGSTGLLGGKRISKADCQIESIGQLDELNAYIGLIASFKNNLNRARLLHSIQEEIFIAGSVLAKDPEKPALRIPDLNSEVVQQLEREIDIMTEKLPPLRYFILPGGNTEAAHIHIARTVCRRAERTIVGLESKEKDAILVFLNRLSDYLFVLARTILKEMDTAEIYWIPKK